MSFRKLITEGVDPEQNEEPKTLSKKKKPAASATSQISQTKIKGKGGKGQKKMQAVLDFKQGSTRLKVKMPFNKSSDSHDSDKMLAGPSTKSIGQLRIQIKKKTLN